MTPAQPHPIPSIAAKLQFAYTAINVAICSQNKRKHQQGFFELFEGTCRKAEGSMGRNEDITVHSPAVQPKKRIQALILDAQHKTNS